MLMYLRRAARPRSQTESNKQTYPAKLVLVHFPWAQGFRFSSAYVGAGLDTLTALPKKSRPVGFIQ